MVPSVESFPTNASTVPIGLNPRTMPDEIMVKYVFPSLSASTPCAQSSEADPI